MITRRRFISITLMMIALFILFQGPLLIREQYNDYRFNKYYEENTLHFNDVWKGEDTAKEEVIFIGDDENILSGIKEWANYSKRRVLSFNGIEDGLSACNSFTKLVIMTPECWEDENLEDKIHQMMDVGINVLFTDLPLFSRIQNREAAKILGIDDVVLQHIDVDGFRLFEGFFLGGERYFLAKDETEKKRQDLNLKVTWYRTGQGVETYMMGVFKDDLYKGKKIENEELPPIMWSCSSGTAKAYVIQGDYFSNRMIEMGILSSVMADCKQIDLYPIVDAQQIQILNYPTLTDENGQKMSDIYGRSLTQFERLIVYPGIVADTDGNGFRFTSYVMPQEDYLDQEGPSDGELTWYLSQFNEKKDELGYSLEHNSNISLEEKLKHDTDVFLKEAPDYKIAAVYVTPEEADLFYDILPERLKSSVNTVCTQYFKNKPIIGYINNDVTLQQSTASVNAFSYTNDLEMLGIETTLGYASIAIDMKEILWPEDLDDEWQNASRRIFSLIDTYWTKFKVFEKTTASETDRKIRNLLSLSYDYSVKENEIRLVLDDNSDKVSFILRMHNRKVTDVSSGSFKKIEQDVYLITVDSDISTIKFEEDINFEQ